MKAYEFIDHTADVGVRVYGKDLKTLFQNAAIAMFELIAAPLKSSAKNNSRKFKIELSAECVEELLIRWLSELNCLSECKKVILNGFEITRLSEKFLSARVRGLSRQQFSIATEIKAVTYHALKIQKINSRYSVQIIFDV